MRRTGYVSANDEIATKTRKNVKSFTIHKAHRVALVSVSLALSQLTLQDH